MSNQKVGSETLDNVIEIHNFNSPTQILDETKTQINNNLNTIESETGRKKICAWLSNPFMNFIFNNQDFKRSGPLKEVISRICTNPADYAILIPSTMFLTFNVDKDSGKPLSELCKELDFILSHIIRLDVSKELRIRTHKEFTTLNNKTVTIKADKITSIKNFKYPVSVDIINQELIRGFADYIPIGTCFHVVYITGCMFGNYKFMGNMKNMLITSEDNFTELNKKKKEITIIDK